MYASGSTLEGFSPAFTVLAGSQRKATPAVGRDGIPCRVACRGTGGAGYVPAGSARRGTQEVWQYDTKIRRIALHLDRALDERPRAGFAPFLSRLEARRGVRCVCDSDR